VIRAGKAAPASAQKEIKFDTKVEEVEKETLNQYARDAREVL